MSSDWAPADIHRALQPFLDQWGIDAVCPALFVEANVLMFAFQIVTFDSQGISGHRNHRALPAALSSHDLGLPVYSLQSSSVLMKFSNILSLPLTSLTQLIKGPSGQSLLLSTPQEVRQANEAFGQHSSQAVWFRWLYCTFSKYVWWNELVPLDHPTATATSKDEL